MGYVETERSEEPVVTAPPHRSWVCGLGRMWPVPGIPTPAHGQRARRGAATPRVLILCLNIKQGSDMTGLYFTEIILDSVWRMDLKM